MHVINCKKNKTNVNGGGKILETPQSPPKMTTGLKKLLLAHKYLSNVVQSLLQFIVVNCIVFSYFICAYNKIKEKKYTITLETAQVKES